MHPCAVHLTLGTHLVRVLIRSIKDVKEGYAVATKTKTGIEPLEDRVVIRPLDAEEVTSSGLVIPDTAKEKPQEGEVIAVGPGRVDDNGKRIPVEVKDGDRVLYSKYAGTEVKIDGEELLVVPARDILARIK
jgi:chaperonin GroES